MQPKLKEAAAYRLMGTSPARLDIPAKVDGTADYALDVDLPGMKYAAVMAAPIFGATVTSIDASTAKGMRGVEQIVDEGDFVAIIADSYWYAQQALLTLDVKWSETGRENQSQAEIFDQFRADMARATTKGAEEIDVEIGDARAAAMSASSRFEAAYTVPYLAHATMEPINAVAEVKGDTVDVWVGHQNPLSARDEVASTLGFRPENVTLHNHMLGGGFGRKAMNDYPLMAVRIAKHTDGPVKMIWSREQDTQQDFYRPATTAKVVAGLDEGGMPTSWEYQYVIKHDPVEASRIPYAVPNQLVHHAETDNPIRFGFWRSVDHTQHGFFIESFIDELAHAAGMDPVEYRLSLLVDKPRHTAALKAVRDMSGWGRTLPAGVGLGVAVVESFGTVVAQAAEVDMSSGLPKVTQVWAAADPGFVVNPDAFTGQIESGIIYGLSAALYGNITVENGAVLQSNFHDYPVVRMDEAPSIAVRLINSGAPLGGGGEPGTPPITPAVTNAIFSATGKRLRTLPIVTEDMELNI